MALEAVRALLREDRGRVVLVRGQVAQDWAERCLRRETPRAEGRQRVRDNGVEDSATRR